MCLTGAARKWSSCYRAVLSRYCCVSLFCWTPASSLLRYCSTCTPSKVGRSLRTLRSQLSTTTKLVAFGVIFVVGFTIIIVTSVHMATRHQQPRRRRFGFWPKCSSFQRKSIVVKRSWMSCCNTSRRPGRRNSTATRATISTTSCRHVPLLILDVTWKYWHKYVRQTLKTGRTIGRETTVIRTSPLP